LTAQLSYGFDDEKVRKNGLQTEKILYRKKGIKRKLRKNIDRRKETKKE